jgi:hypothetical protein
MPLLISLTINSPTEVRIEDQTGQRVEHLGIDFGVSIAEWEDLTEEQIIDMFMRPAVAQLKARENLTGLYRRHSSFDRED